MTSFCNAPDADALAVELLAVADCHAFGLVERGYAALAAPQGPVSVGLNGLLVVAVAFFGYRLLLGRGLVISEAVALTIKIGIVLMIASSWGTWQIIAYDTFARAPTRIAAELLGSIGAKDPIAQLQIALDQLEAASTGYRSRAGIASPLVGGPAASAMTLTLASLILGQSIAGILVAARIILAILLAIAPVMAGFILFDTTRGTVAGWLAAMASAALAPLFVLTIAAIEFAILMPLIAQNLAEQSQGRFEPESVTPIGIVVLVFALTMLASLFIAMRIAGGIRLFRAEKQAVENKSDPVPPSADRTREIISENRSESLIRVLGRKSSRERIEQEGTAATARWTIQASATGSQGSSRRGTEPVFAGSSLRLTSPPLAAFRRSRAAQRRDM